MKLRKPVSLLLVLMLLLSTAPLTAIAAQLPEDSAAGDVVYYDIWLGKTRVSSANLNDILGDGGKAKYNPNSKTLTLDEPNIPKPPEGTETMIFIDVDGITIAGSWHMSRALETTGILASGNLTLNGDFTLLGYEDGIAVYGNLTIAGGTVRGEKTVANEYKDNPGAGIYVPEGTLIVNSTVTRVQAEGCQYALVADEMVLNGMGITSPANAFYSQYMNSVVYGDESEIATSVVIEPQSYTVYGLMLGNTRVTSQNKDDIFGDGKASYDPVSCTLTLNEPNISGSFRPPGTDVRYKIYAETPSLTIEGSYTMSDAECYGAVYSIFPLILNGDLTLIGENIAVYAHNGVNLRGGSVKIIGDSKIIYAPNGDIVFENGLTRAELCSEKYTVSARNIIIQRDLRITAPKDCAIGTSSVDDREFFADALSGELVKHVVIEPFVSYLITLGGTAVTNLNKDDILGDGGKAKYDPKTKTLTLNDPVIEGVDTYDSKTFKIVTTNIITIKGSYHMDSADATYGIKANESVTFEGDFTFMGTESAVLAHRNVNINSGSFKAVSEGDVAIQSTNGGFCILEGTRRLEARSASTAIVSKFIEISSDLMVYSPLPWVMDKIANSNNWTIADYSGDTPTPASTVVIKYTDYLTRRIGGEGTQDSPWIINSKEDWDIVAKYIADGGITEGKCFRLSVSNPITVSTSWGTEKNPFAGSFRGSKSLVNDNNTIKLELSSSGEYCAPFRYISDATIRDIKVTGTVSGGAHCSGLVGKAADGNNYITKVEVAASITCSSSRCGGFVGEGGSCSVTLDGCVFNGSISGASSAGTFWGWSDTGASPVLKNCLDISESNYPIGIGYPQSPTVTNTYYTNPNKTAGNERPWSNRGKRAYTVRSDNFPWLSFKNGGDTGVLWNHVLYAAEGESLTINTERYNAYYGVSAGEFTQRGAMIYLTMPAENVTVYITETFDVYPLWVSGVQVTSKNCDDILGDGGSAAYDSDTKTLTLNEPNITGNHSGAAIYSNFNLTIAGSWHMASSVSDIAIDGAKVILDGDFDLKGRVKAIECGDLEVRSGTLRAEAQNSATIWAEGTVTFGNGITSATIVAGHDGAFYIRGFELGSELRLTNPADGVFVDDDYGYQFIRSSNPIQFVLIEQKTAPPVDFYPVWVGNTQIHSNNKNDILGDGGKAKYDPDTHTLTLSEPDIDTVIQIGTDTSKIYAKNTDLTIKGSWHMAQGDGSSKRAVNVKYGNLTLDGDFSFSGSLAGVYCTDYTTVLSGNVKSANRTGSPNPAFYSYDGITFGDDVLTFEAISYSDDRAVKGKTISLGSKLTMLEPADGNTGEAKHVLIEQTDYFDPFEGSGTEQSPYLIKTRDDWDRLSRIIIADCPSGSNSTSGKHFKLMNDIAVSTMLGSSDKIFEGSFDGNGKTITISLSSDEEYCAPFRYAAGDVIKNLKVNGTVNAAEHCAALIGSFVGSDILIENVEVAAEIDSLGFTCGGFVAHGGSGTILFKDCLFTGNITGAVIVGTYIGDSNSDADITLNNCLDVSDVDFPLNAGPSRPKHFKTYYTCSDKYNSVGYCAHTVTCDCADLTLTGTKGRIYNGEILAGETETITLTASDASITYAANAGQLTQNGASLTLVMPTKNVVIFSPRYNITFDAGDGEVSPGSALTNSYGKLLELPEPERSGYFFGGWWTSPEYSNGVHGGTEITADTEFEADQTIYAHWYKKYWVYFVNWGSEDLQIEYLPEGELPVYKGETPKTPSTDKYDFTFKGWDKEIVPVSDHVSYRATYTGTVRSYEIRFLDYDGTVLQSETLEYGATPVYSEAQPSRAAEGDNVYDYEGWDKEIATVTGEATYTAVYSARPKLQLGSNSVTLTEYKEQHCLFTPTANGDYRFLSESETDPWIKIYDGDTMVAYDYDSGGNWQFDCIAGLEAGKTYDVVIRSVNGSGEVNVNITSVTMYNVTVDNSDPNGTAYAINLTDGKAYAGQEVQILNDPEEGYMLAGLSVTADGQSFEAGSDGFVMIAADVTVTPHFSKTYPVTVTADDYAFPLSVDANGLMLGVEEAEVGAGIKARLELAFEEGYMPDQITVTAKDGTNLPFALSRESGEIVVSFTMPEQEVNITVTSKECGVGDTNLDGWIDIIDATTIQKHLAGLIALEGKALASADTDGSGTVDINDVTHLQKYLAKYDVALG